MEFTGTGVVGVATLRAKRLSTSLVIWKNTVPALLLLSSSSALLVVLLWTVVELTACSTKVELKANVSPCWTVRPVKTTTNEVAVAAAVLAFVERGMD